MIYIAILGSLFCYLMLDMNFRSYLAVFESIIILCIPKISLAINESIIIIDTIV